MDEESQNQSRRTHTVQRMDGSWWAFGSIEHVLTLVKPKANFAENQTIVLFTCYIRVCCVQCFWRCWLFGLSCFPTWGKTWHFPLDFSFGFCTFLQIWLHLLFYSSGGTLRLPESLWSMHFLRSAHEFINRTDNIVYDSERRNYVKTPKSTKYCMKMCTIL